MGAPQAGPPNMGWPDVDANRPAPRSPSDPTAPTRGIFDPRRMSAFSKPPNDAGNPGAPKPEAKPAPAPKPAAPVGPPVTAPRTTDVGPAPKTRPAAPPPQTTPTLRMDNAPKSVRPSAPPMA